MGVGRKATPYILRRVTVMARDMVRLPIGGLALRGTPVYQRCPPFVRWVVVGAAAALARPQTPAWPRLGPAGPPGPAGGSGASVGRASGLSALLGPPSFPWRWSNKERSGPGKAFRAVGGGPGQWPRLRVRGAGAAFALLGLYGPPSLRRGRCPALLGPLPGHSIPREAGGCPPRAPPLQFRRVLLN